MYKSLLHCRALRAALSLSALVICGLAGKAVADQKSDAKIELADGKLVLTAPQGWIRKQPKVRFIEHEFAIPASKGDSEDGRVTIMGAGGNVEDNLTRWIGQFSQPDGSETKSQT